MGGSSLGFAIEMLVAVLLAVTIGYCILVNRKLMQLRSDQSELKAIVRDLHSATGQAEQAIAGLRESAHTADETLGHQIERVRMLDEQLRANISKGEALVAKLAAVSRSQAARNISGQQAKPQNPPIRQSAIGLGMLNQERRQQGKLSEHDEVAA